MKTKSVTIVSRQNEYKVLMWNEKEQKQIVMATFKRKFSALCYAYKHVANEETGCIGFTTTKEAKKIGWEV